VKKTIGGKRNSMKTFVRILGRNGVIYEEPMTEAQLKQFLCLAPSETGLGVAFEEWTIEIVDTGVQAAEERELGTNSSSTLAKCSESIGQKSSVSLAGFESRKHPIIRGIL